MAAMPMTYEPARPLPWERVEVVQLLPQPEVTELYGEDADRAYFAALALQYPSKDDRSFAPTAAAPL